MAEDTASRLVVGRVGGPHGVHGWLRVHSYTEPRENILRYSPWQLRLARRWLSVEVAEGRRHGKGIIAKLIGYNDREAARSLTGVLIAIAREQLPALEAEEFYWADLLGLRVVNRTGCELGRVVGLAPTGANDVLVIRGDRERLIPFLWGDVVLAVDVAEGIIRVDWEPEF